MQTVNIHLITETAIMPTQSSPGAAGWDLYADETLKLMPHQRAMVATGFAITLPTDTVGLIWPRSGLALKQGIDVLAGVVDCDYRGEVRVVLQNHGSEPVAIAEGDRIAQLLVQPIVPVRMQATDALGETHRGGRGFGSSGR